MTSHAAYLVTLAGDIAEEGIDNGPNPTLTAIRMIKGVIRVQPVEGSYEQVIARNRRDRAWETSLRNLAREGPPESES
jgi:hypothetical protein